MVPAHDDILVGIDSAGNGGHNVVLVGILPGKLLQYDVGDAKADELLANPLRHLLAIAGAGVAGLEILQVLQQALHGGGVHHRHHLFYLGAVIAGGLLAQTGIWKA